MKHFVAAFFVGFIGVLGCSAAPAKAPVHADDAEFSISLKLYVGGAEAAADTKVPAGTQCKLVVDGGPVTVRWLTTLPETAWELADNDRKMFFSPPAAGKYTIVLAGCKGEKQLALVAQVVEVIGGSGPTPPEPHPPTPIPPDPPQPTPVEPTPAPGQIRVLIVEETADRGKPAMKPWVDGRVFTSTLIREYLNTHCSKTGNMPDWRWFDDDTDLSGESQKWKDAMAMPRSSLPWIVICNGKDCYSGELPQTADAVLALLRKWGGA